MGAGAIGRCAERGAEKPRRWVGTSNARGNGVDSGCHVSEKSEGEKEGLVYQCLIRNRWSVSSGKWNRCSGLWRCRFRAFFNVGENWLTRIFMKEDGGAYRYRGGLF